MDAPGTDWFRDSDALQHELRRAFARRPDAPAIAGYRDLQEIGRGGQATVYRATQASTRRTVALKVFHDLPGRNAPALRRFEREVDLISALRHPSIVTLYDGGVTPEGHPYLVMELVRGTTLDSCPAVAALARDASPENAAAVLTILAEVAGALAHAHRRGVIHRDVKPANVLVTEEGTARVLDFGLARVAPGSDLDVATRSMDGGFAGSLPWASPEQARGEHVDVRSDVWSFGVMAYEALAGRPPRELPDDLVGALAAVADPRLVRLATARPELGSDVDAVVMRCLAVEPDRRYQSAGELARDLGHLLSGEPIEARADSAWYTWTRQLRRWRRALLATGAVTLLLVIALVVSLGALDAARDAERREADEARRLRATLTFAVSMIGSVDPDADGEDARLVDLLDRTAPELDDVFAGDVESRILLRTTIARVYLQLGRYGEARRQYTRLLDDLRATRGPDDVETLNAELQLLRVRYHQDEVDAVGSALEPLASRMESAHGSTPDDAIEARSLRALVHRRRREFEEAERIWSELLETIPPGTEPLLALSIEEHLAGLDDMQGRPREALARQVRVCAERERIQGPDHSKTLLSRSDLAYYHMALQELDAAEEILVETERRARDRLGASHPKTLMLSENLAKLVQDRGRAGEALGRFEKIFEHRLDRFGPRHKTTLVTMNNVAVARNLTGDREGAIEMHRRLLDARRKTLPPDSVDIIISLNNLGGTLCQVGRESEALPYHREAVERAGRALGRTHWLDATMRIMLGNCLTRLQEFDEAETILLAAHGVLDENLGAAHGNTKKARELLRDLYTAWGRADESDKWKP